jgi:hypothetical protein
MRLTVLILDTEKHQDLNKRPFCLILRTPQPVQDVTDVSGASTESAVAIHVTKKMT